MSDSDILRDLYKKGPTPDWSGLMFMATGNG